MLTHKQLEMLWYILSTVATDALVLKHQAISIYSVEQIFIVLDQLQTVTGKNVRKWNYTFWKKKKKKKKITQLFKG